MSAPWKSGVTDRVPKQDTVLGMPEFRQDVGHHVEYRQARTFFAPHLRLETCCSSTDLASINKSGSLFRIALEQVESASLVVMVCEMCDVLFYCELYIE